MKRNALLTILLSITLLTNLTIPLAQAQFSDITDERINKAVHYLEQKGAIRGYPDGKFHPEQPVTRAEFLKMLIQSHSSSSSPASLRVTYPFRDVPEDSWFARYVEEAWNIGLLSDKERLEPQGQLTRVEATRLALNILGLPIARKTTNDEWPTTFADVRHNMWYAPIVLQGTRYGLIRPRDPNGLYFRPLKAITRAEAAELIYNIDVYLLGTQIFDGYYELEGELVSSGLKHDIPHLDILADVWNQIQENHFNPSNKDGINDEKLMYDAIKGLVNGLDDRYSQFFDPPETETFEETLEGEFSGIGAEIEEIEEGNVIIKSFIIGAPAESSGLQPNDRIVKVDEEDVRGLSVTQVAKRVRGEVGTEVKITVERQNEPAPLTFIITRAKIELGYIDGRVIGDALYIDINLFTSTGAEDFKNLVAKLSEEHPDFKGFIIDVRNNPGGYLNTAEKILSFFIEKGDPLVLIRMESHAELHLSTGDGQWFDTPIVVLINENSASAAEILAMMLNETNKAVLVGQQSFGKGTVQQLIDYKDGSTLKLTIAEWRSPGFKGINEVGLSPHVLVEMTDEDRQAGRDPQMDKALEEFELQLKRWENGTRVY